MTKKDYIAFAQAIKETNQDGNRRAGCPSALVERICNIFTSDNPRFDRERFLKACEVKEHAS